MVISNEILCQENLYVKQINMGWDIKESGGPGIEGVGCSREMGVGELDNGKETMNLNLLMKFVFSILFREIFFSFFKNLFFLKKKFSKYFDQLNMRI